MQVRGEVRQLVADHLICLLLILDHLLDQVDLPFELLLRGRIAALRSPDGARSAQFRVLGQGASLVEIGALVQVRVAERRGVVLGGAAVGHLAYDTSVHETV